MWIGSFLLNTVNFHSPLLLYLCHRQSIRTEGGGREPGKLKMFDILKYLTCSLSQFCHEKLPSTGVLSFSSLRSTLVSFLLFSSSFFEGTGKGRSPLIPPPLDPSMTYAHIHNSIFVTKSLVIIHFSPILYYIYKCYV